MTDITIGASDHGGGFNLMEIKVDPVLAQFDVRPAELAKAILAFLKPKIETGQGRTYLLHAQVWHGEDEDEVILP